MQEAAAAPPGPAYTGGISTILSGTNNFISEVVVLTIETFNTTVRNNTVAARIKKATTPAELDQNAKQIAARASPRSDSTQEAMRDLVKLETNKATAALQRKIASLQGQLDGRAAGGAGKKKKGAAKKDFRSKGKTAGRNDASSKARAGAAGPGNASAAASKKNKKKNSGGKSGGKKGGNGTAKRS